MTGRLGIDDVTPQVAGGRDPAKAVVGEHVPITATVWREGHDAVAATVVWWGPDGRERTTRMTDLADGLDHFAATIVPDDVGLWTFRVDAWGDPWATWTHAASVKRAAGQGADELANDLEIGARLLDLKIGRRRKGLLKDAATALRATELPIDDRLALALGPEVQQAMHDDPVRELITEGEPLVLDVDRTRAAFGSWYELFPRSTGGVDPAGNPRHGTFKTTTKALDRVAQMGFDVVYFPPIHPIGRINRKGKDNTLTPTPDDVGSPWAIGAVEGGHDTIHPELGTMKDFDALIKRAKALDLEIALDLALQAAPDHPWAAEHPEFFTVLPDGTIAYAENPPKKYQDIYPLNFDNDPDAAYAEMLRVTMVWVERGVRIFRVDNPHTKPTNFWAWLIATVKKTHPDVLFLAEAFTRPARLYGLGRAGFTQSYTYFTWRTTKAEIIDFAEEIRDHWDESRPNLFVNTPDILPEHLQVGGPAMFAIRAALASTLSPTWGVYSGFEIYEHEPQKPGSEEYLHSEKFELRPRDWAAALEEGRSLEPWITRLNEIRRDHPALQQMRTLHVHDVDHEALVAYSKQDPATGDTVLVVVTLDPHEAREGTVHIDLPALGLAWDDRLVAHDEVTGESYDWGAANYVRLDPTRAVAHILSLQRRPEEPERELT
ncbi:alpha-1,4-glucan--maltose-1-phosphate maltosyltransferase [Aeromicrobium wangtongii]|uniref:Alpha-1,4-glucan:maltose-1-phosphate maltosyltransferase n=1 Tax=Aeromicrobium wangtongii TaxID=2969247 RepID=A0ABY5M3I4_9ACTN|nr:alpha-1,4-glucan--maltose-1-phosphate maltosyltransferase [Aeromicrobium wangtongii]MCD9199223.1 alpha-1,4-glucan--maltose-1-phosphate maltosyltransferase [Aeromicrobium wangtongii]UUP12750.1 alpha-1,4-glucan--maltose-1-phosphate maltosyltransferase [Aeromicrobium wangtongii]